MSTTESKNSNLQRAKSAHDDEFYTRIEDIEAELWHYRDHFRGKTVYFRVLVRATQCPANES